MLVEVLSLLKFVVLLSRLWGSNKEKYIDKLNGPVMFVFLMTKELLVLSLFPAGQHGPVESVTAVGDAVSGAAVSLVQWQLPYGAAAVLGPLDREPGLVSCNNRIWHKRFKKTLNFNTLEVCVVWLSIGQLSDQQSSPWLCSLVNQTERPFWRLRKPLQVFWVD